MDRVDTLIYGYTYLYFSSRPLDGPRSLAFHKQWPERSFQLQQDTVQPIRIGAHPVRAGRKVDKRPQEQPKKRFLAARVVETWYLRDAARVLGHRVQILLKRYLL